MKAIILGCILALATMLSGCSTPSRLVYSSGFSFANYDYVVVAKVDNKSSTSLYGMDVEFSNLMSSYNMKVIGDKEYEKLPSEKQSRTLNARMSVTANSEMVILSVTFDDMVSGRIGSSITSYTKGDLFDLKDRTKAWESAAKGIVQAIENDKRLNVSNPADLQKHKSNSVLIEQKDKQKKRTSIGADNPSGALLEGKHQQRDVLKNEIQGKPERVSLH